MSTFEEWYYGILYVVAALGVLRGVWLVADRRGFERGLSEGQKLGLSERHALAQEAYEWGLRHAKGQYTVERP